MMRRLLKKKRQNERGAAMVEMAVVAPLLILLVFGIMEMGWLFAQQVEVRHGAREGARIAAVSAPDLDGGGFGSSDVVLRTCNAIDLSSASTVTVMLAAGGSDIGDEATITVTSSYASLTGVLDGIFAGLTIDTDVDFRLEQPRLWSPAAPVACP